MSDPRGNDLRTDSFDVRGLLETAADTRPRESDPVGAVLRRHRHARRRTTVLAAGGLVAACAAAGLLATVPGGDTVRPRIVPPAGPAAPDTAAPDTAWTPPGIEPSPRGINGVEVTAPSYRAEVGTDACGVPGAVTVVAAPVLDEGTCDLTFHGPGAAVLPAVRLDWQTGYPESPGLTMVDGVPVFISDMPYGDESTATVTVPSRAVRVKLGGNEAQVQGLLDSITIEARPTERQAPTLASRKPLALVRVTDSGGTEWGGTTQDPALLESLRAVVDAATPVQGEPPCLPALQDFAQVDLQTAVGSVPSEGPVQEYTYLAVDRSGRCDVALASTGAIVQLEPVRLSQILQQIVDASAEEAG